MPLTASEVRLVTVIPSELARTDPALVQTLDSGLLAPHAIVPARRGTRRARYVSALGLAVLLSTLGIAVHVPVMCVCGWFTLLTVMAVHGVSG